MAPTTFPSLRFPAVCPSRSSHPLTFHWNGPSTLPKVRQGAQQARTFLSELGFSEGECFQWELLLTEAGNNAVHHAVSGIPDPHAPFQFFLEVHPDRVIARVEDPSKNFHWPEDIDLPEPLEECGRGLYLIRELSDHHDYQRGRSRNTLIMERRHEENLTLSHSPQVLELERTLDEMTHELSACYESLATVFRFSEECREDRDLPALGERLLGHLAHAIGADCSTLRLQSPETDQLETLAVYPSTQEPTSFPSPEGQALEAQAICGRSDQWIDAPHAHAHAHHMADPSQATSGMAHPFYDGDTLMGVLTVGKNTVGATLSAADVQIIHTFADLLGQKVKDRRREALAMETRVHRHEIELAAAIQRSLLPEPSKEKHPLQVTGYCRSAQQVGGDFYDVIPRDDGSTLFVIADVMGKGLGASMMAAITRSVIRTVAHHSSSPAHMLQEAAQRLHADFDRLDMFVTVAIGLVNPRERTLCVANAGHCPIALHLPRRQDLLIEPTALPLGLESQPVIAQQVLSLTEGSHILGFTDGFLDPRSKDHFTSPQALLAWMQALPLNEMDAEAFKGALLAYLSPSQSASADDVTFVNLHLQTA